MGYFNKVILLGNITRDPELRTLPSDSKVADFGLAVNRRYKTQGGEDREETLFIDCAAFGRNAELIHEYCAKGKPLLIEGHLKLDNWQDAQSGMKRSKITAVVETFQFVAARDTSAAPSSSATPSHDPKRVAPESPAARDPRAQTPAADSTDRKVDIMFEENRSYDSEIPF